jgi:GDP-4-dehydro-6-deoxy-D-mannose reductase
MRPSETPRLVGSYAKLQQDTGWQPEIPLDQSLREALAEWLIRLDNN